MKITHRHLILLAFFFVGLSGCLSMPMGIMPAKENIDSDSPAQSPTEWIFSCLDRSSALSSEDLVLQHKKAATAFSVMKGTEQRLELICINLVRHDEPTSLAAAQELIQEMPEFNAPTHPDLRGLAHFINAVQRRHDKIIVEKANAAEQSSQLKTQLLETTQKLEELKSIEKILIDRKNAN